MRFSIYLISQLLVLFSCMQVRAQEQSRGFGTVMPPDASAKAGRTVALVVGVSDYPFVTPLNYAAEDALLMYDFLQSSAGGNVSPANIRLLINEEATLQNVWCRGLSWIENTVKPAHGDRVIIYLAGHSDAIDADESFFLCHNVNPAGDKNNYFVSGALNIRALKNRIAKFSAAGAEVVLIMDACRSGDLPGARTGINNPFESVVEIKAGETLMLSAGANQLAVEDRRWGRGHGIFTWYLVQGLSGKADENGDGVVDFFEIEQYTKAKVRKETQSMGRMQVPQFASPPSGMGWQSKTDARFLSKLETESLSGVNVSESIALARSTAESSWFTDSTLYAGFNELKKLVRKGSYLGDGSAEVIYEQLATQFSVDQMEPVRVYYMSALAGAGFEAINQELRIDIGSKRTTKFYERRLNYLNKAWALQRFSGEVDNLESYRKLLEAIYSTKIASEGKNWNCTYSNGMVDSLSRLRMEFPESAAYYNWMLFPSIDPWTSRQLIWSRDNKKEIDSLNSVLTECMFRIAPDWPKVIEKKFYSLGVNEFEQSFGDHLLELLKTDSTNAEYWYLLSIYYCRHKPYDILNSYRCLLKSCDLRPNGDAAARLFAIANIGGDEFKSYEVWFMCEALRNHYNYQVGEHDWQQLKRIASGLLDEELSDEVSLDWRAQFGLTDFIDLGMRLNKKEDLLQIFSNRVNLKPLDAFATVLLSSAIADDSRYMYFSNRLDSLIALAYSDMEWRFFDEDRLECLARRIEKMQGRSYLRDALPLEISKLRELISELNDTTLSNQYLLFMARVFLDKTLNVPESFLDSLHDVCIRNLKSKRSTNGNLYSYWRLISHRKLYSRMVDLFSDKSFRNCAISQLSNGNPDSSFYFDVEAGAYAAAYYILQDTISLIADMAERAENNPESFFRILMYLDSSDKKLVIRHVQFSVDSTYSGFRKLMSLQMYAEAMRLYTSGNLDIPDDNSSFVRSEFIRGFNELGEFESASKELELQIDEFMNVGDGFWGSDIPFSGRIGPYDAFVRSKEYKAMMARVCTLPEK